MVVGESGVVVVGCVLAVAVLAVAAVVAVASFGDAMAAGVGLGEFAPAIPAITRKARTPPAVIHGHFRRFFGGR